MSAKRFPVPLWLILLVGVAAISFSAIFVRWSEAPVAVIAMYRLVLTDVLLLPFVWKRFSTFRGLSAKSWLLLFASGSMLGLHFLFWMASLRFTTVASSTALLTLEPVLVMLGSYLLYKHATPPLALLGMAAAICGAALIGWGDFGLSTRALTGDLLSILGTVAIAAHMMIGKSLRMHVPAFAYSFVVFAFAAGILAGYNALAGYSFTGYPGKEWGIFLLLAIVPTLMGHYLFNWLLKHMKAVSVSMTVLGEPLGAALLAYFLLGESITLLQGGAALLLVSGVWLFIRFGENEPDRIKTVESKRISPPW